MSTLPPEPTYNPNIPVVTPGGGTADSYKDPNSPESIMKKTATTQAQANVDSRYDVKEGFQSNSHRLLLPFIFLLILALFIKTRKETATIYIIALASILLLLYVILSQNGRTASRS